MADQNHNPRIRPDVRLRAAAAALAAVSLAAAPGAGQTPTLISRTPAGAGGDRPSLMCRGGGLSTFGRHAVFISEATDLAPGDSNSAADVFAFDAATGTVSRVSVSSGGGEGSAGGGYGQFGQLSPGAAISRDGRYVAFVSMSSDLVASDTNGWADIFHHDRDADGNGVYDEPGGIATTLVSVSASGAQAMSHSGGPSVSADGRYVCFVTAAPLVSGDTNLVDDVYIRDVVAGTTLRVSVDSSGGQGNGPSRAAVLSADGRFVAFESSATDLVAGDSNGADDVFLRDLVAGTTVRVSLDSSGGQASGASAAGSISADGRFVAFLSLAPNIVSGDTNGAWDAFIHDTVSGTTARVSVATSGAQGNDDTLSVSVSDSGRYAAFLTEATNFGPGAPNYVFHIDRDVDGNGVYDEPGGIATTLASRLAPGSIPSSSPAGPNQRWAEISGAGDTIAYGVMGAQAYVNPRGLSDTDGDGLMDYWEVVGVDADLDGALDLALPAGLSPMHKDLIVEVDAMTGRLPAAWTLARLRQAYASVPNALVQNPDGQPGVNLQLIIDETGIAQRTFDFGNPWPWPVPPAPAQNTFVWHRNQFKGTAAERASPNWPNIQAAILLTRRYCLFADMVGTGSPPGPSGQGEFLGNDFYIALGGFNPPGGSATDQIGVFMHELGHNLGLGHGGNQFDAANPWNDRFNYKPNYHSVMNYTWTFAAGLLAPSWTADYSRAVWPALDETNLIEAAGIGGAPGRLTIFGPPGTGGHTFPAMIPPCPWTTAFPQAYLAPEAGAVDWDLNCSSTGRGVQRDINDLGGNPGLWPSDLLAGFNDWANLSWSLAGQLDAPIEPVPHTAEPTFELRRRLDAMGWRDDLDTYTPGDDMHARGGWEIWCDGGADAVITAAPVLSPPGALAIHGGPEGTDIVKPFAIDSGRWTLSMNTFVPGGAAGAGYVILLNQYCEPHNWSMQLAFDATAGVVRSDGDESSLPLIRDRWVELTVEIDLRRDRFSIFYDGAPLAEELVWTQNVSGRLGEPGIAEIAALDLYAEDIAEMYFDDLTLTPISCYPDCDGSGALDFFDFLCFQNAFGAGEGYADCDASGRHDFFDFLCFQDAFGAGCP